MDKRIKLSKLLMGVCYYPEHWPEAVWGQDLARMREIGIEVIRIAEFAWSEFEPAEGVFQGGLFDRFMELVAKTDMKVIFCTPTATPPAWLSEKYPEILNAKKDGTVLRHGLRKHYNYNSKVYHSKTRGIVRFLVNRYGKHPSIIGWQTDNEYNWGVDEFYSEADHQEFRVFLREKYGALDNLNEAWGTVFWNQRYTDWEEIYLERPNVKDMPNPHLALDSKRFFSQSAVRYAKLQYDILRAALPADIFITSNGYFRHIDHNDMVENSLDFLTHNSYPSFGFNAKLSPPEDTPLLDRMASFALTKVRGISPVFGIMEQQSGAGGWLSEHFQPMPKPGQMRLWTFQSIVHGADLVSYFRWRTCTFGTEMYWHGILNHDGKDNRRLEEVGRIHRDMEKLGCVAGGRYEAKVALLHDYDNDWDSELDLWHGPLAQKSYTAWFTALQKAHIPFDYLNLRYDADRLCNYDLVVYPHAVILDAKDAEQLARYVREGGKLIVGARSGLKDRDGHCRTEALPGPLAETLGVEINDFTYLSYLEQDSEAIWGAERIDTALFNDIITLTGKGCSALATYVVDYYAGKPALTKNRYGAGEAYYFGAAFSVQAVGLILSKLGFFATYGEIVDLPECCEVAVRYNEEHRVLFVLNYAAEPAQIRVKKPLADLLGEKTIDGVVQMEPFGVLALRLGEIDA